MIFQLIFSHMISSELLAPYVGGLSYGALYTLLTLTYSVALNNIQRGIQTTSKLEWTYMCPRQMVGVKLNWLPRVFFKGEDDCNRFSRVQNVI